MDLRTPLADDATFGLADRTTWQSTPFPNMIKMATPKNSANGSRMNALHSRQIYIAFLKIKSSQNELTDIATID